MEPHAPAQIGALSAVVAAACETAELAAVTVVASTGRDVLLTGRWRGRDVHAKVARDGMLREAQLLAAAPAASAAPLWASEQMVILEGLHRPARLQSRRRLLAAAAATLRAQWETPPPAIPLTPVAEHVGLLLTASSALCHTDAEADLVRSAADACGPLDGDVFCHGDVRVRHLWSTGPGRRTPAVLISPAGLVGDPAFDVAHLAVVDHQAFAGPAAAGTVDAVETAVVTAARRAGQPEARVRAAAVAVAVADGLYRRYLSPAPYDDELAHAELAWAARQL